jgi:hemerythrin-like domain-containing protein
MSADTATPLAAELRDEHDAMLETLAAVRVALLRGAVDRAREQLARLGEQQARHIARENAALIPQLPAAARWSARVYLAEHDKLERMHAELVALLAPLPARVDDAELQLGLLDAHAPFKHLLEHHFEREQQGLFVEVAQAADSR